MKRTDLPIHWTAELFKVFQARYFHKFTSGIEGIEEKAIKEWSKGLYNITAEQIKNGIDSLDGDWPPSLSEFRRFCLGNECKKMHNDYIKEDNIVLCKDNKKFMAEIKCFLL